MRKILAQVAKHSVIYGAGDVLNKSIAFVLLPVYTRFLDPQAYGVLELLDLTTYILGILLGMGISQAIVRHYFEHAEEEKRRLVLSSGLLAVWGFSLLALCVLLAGAGGVSRLVFNSPDYAHLFRIIFVTMVVHLGAEIPLVYLRIQQKSVAYIAASTGKLLLNIGCNLLFLVHYRMGPEGILLGSLIATSASGLVLSTYLIRQVGFRFSPAVLRPMLRYGFPLIGNWIGMFVINYADRFFLQRFASLHEVGLYSLAYKFGMLPNLLILNPFLMLWSPKQFEVVREEKAPRIFAAVFTYFMAVMAFSALAIAVLSRDIVRWVTDPQYHAAHVYIPLLVFGYVFFGAFWFCQFGILYRKKTQYLAFSTVSLALGNTALNWLLIPRFGAWGAAWATFFTLFGMSAAVYALSQPLYRIPYETRRLAKVGAAVAACAALGFWVDIEALWASMALKAGALATFPLWLGLLRFYRPEETALMRRAAFALPGLGRAAGSPP